MILSAVIALANQDTAWAVEASLQLEVFINDSPTKLIGAFTRLPDGRFAATRAELTELGVKVPASGKPEDLAVIEDLGVSYRYDEPQQKIYLSLGDAQRVTKIYDLRGSVAPGPAARNDYGAVMNYSLFASSSKELDGALNFSGANVSLDARLFSPYGTLTQTGIVGSTLTREFDMLRLDTTWSYSDPDSVLTYRAGDTISGGLAWTRPIRLGGVQVQRNFALRPDLVTLPLQSTSGSAAVPSTVDVYVNGVKTQSQEVGAGPYQINNLPTAGAGTARIVVHDASGRTVEVNMPFYSSSRLLRPSLVDFSVEAGLPRLLYGRESFSYANDPVASATLRRGIADWLTVEGHAEGGAGLMNGGAGAVVGVGSWGVLSLAGTASQFNGASGFQSYAAFDTRVGRFNIHASTQRTFGSYDDIASVSARSLALLQDPLEHSTGMPHASFFYGTYRPPKFLDTVSVSFPVAGLKGNVGVGFLHLETADGKQSNIGNLSYSRTLPWNASLHVSAFTDFKDKKTGGIFAGISVPLGGSMSASTGVAQDRRGTSFTADVSKTLQPEVGGYGWRLHDTEGQATYRTAMGAYRSSIAQFEGSVWQNNGSSGGSMQVQGAIATMGGSVFLSNRIDDSFAVVDAGAPNVDVLHENRPAGKTNARGKALVPTLRSYQPNKIAIDPAGLPVDADIESTQAIVTPADRTGVLVRFGVKTDVKSAVVVLAGKTGAFLPAGSTGQLEGTEETFIVGYDGRAFVKGLGAANNLIVVSGAGECRASFPFAPQQNSQVVIGPVACQ